MRATTSASNIFRRQLCPGSHAAEEAFPEQEDSEYSTEGTLLHDLDANPEKDRSALTTEQKELLSRSAVADENIFAAVKSSMSIPDDAEFEEGRETAMWLRKGIKQLFPGHCDRWRYYSGYKTLIIIDKKFGYLPVEAAATNLQLRAYAVMGAAKWDCDNVLVAITQPRLSMEERLTISDYDRAAIAEAKQHLLDIWETCHQPDAPRAADAEKQCRYCQARVHCDAYRAKYDWMSKIPGDQVEMFKEQLAALTAEQLDTVLQACGFAEKVYEAVKSEARKRIEAGELPMYQLGAAVPQSTITDPVKAYKILREAGLSQEEILSCSRLGLTDLAEKFQTRERLSVVNAKKRLRDVIKPVLEVGAKAQSVTRIPNWAPQISNDQPELI